MGSAGGKCFNVASEFQRLLRVYGRFLWHTLFQSQVSSVQIEPFDKSNSLCQMPSETVNEKIVFVGPGPGTEVGIILSVHNHTVESVFSPGFKLSSV